MNITKKIPFSWYEVDAVEAWLDEQVQQGLRLVSIKGIFNKTCVFADSADRITRYRIHIKPKDGYYSRQEEYRQTMTELGWQYVDRLNYRADVYQAVNPEAVEINTDEDTLRSALRSTMRQEAVACVLILAYIPFYLRRQLLYYAGNATGFYDLLLNGTILSVISAVLFAVVLLASVIFCVLQLIDQRKRYLLGRSCNVGQLLQKRRWYSVFRGCIVAAVLLCFAAALAGLLTSGETHAATEPCPVVLLEDFAPDEAAQVVTHPGESNPTVYSGRSMLYTFVTYRQDGPTIWSEETGFGHAAFSYWVGINDIASVPLAERYYSEILTAQADWQLVVTDGWDEAAYRCYTTNLRQEFRSDTLPDSPSWRQQELLLRDGSRIINIGYTGDTDLFPLLDELYGKA